MTRLPVSFEFSLLFGRGTATLAALIAQVVLFERLGGDAATAAENLRMTPAAATALLLSALALWWLSLDQIRLQRPVTILLSAVVTLIGASALTDYLLAPEDIVDAPEIPDWLTARMVSPFTAMAMACRASHSPVSAVTCCDGWSIRWRRSS
ncbi:hypothetical protein [Marinobacterium aestuariivivens]|uniref:EamA domain-containing protein n=1 Tax=Marinobacterium aestuariivivens TaxID=1698799 RepID=A0ABW1ZTT4_9GAMM